MMESKIKKAIVCLYGAAGAQILWAVYSVYVTMNFNREIRVSDPMGYQAASLSLPSGDLMWAALTVVAAILVSKELKSGEGWAWIGAICTLIFSSFGFSLPFVIMGLLFLLDREVRTEYLKKLEIIA